MSTYKIIPFLLLIVGLSGCTSSLRSPLTVADFTIKILFNTTTNCPMLVDTPTLDANLGDRVGWQSVDENDVSTEISADYEIFFDPFRGQPKQSNGTGKVPSTPIDQGTPQAVSFKYTIVGDNCTTGIALDPHIKIL